MRLVVFDLDGTLIDSRKDLADAVNALLVELGRPLLTEAAVAGMVGEGARVLIDRALAATGADPALAPAALPRFLALYDERLLDHTVPYAEIPELLSDLHGRVRLAVLTNKPGAATVRILEGLKLARYFEEVIGGDAAFPRKPDPAALLHLMDRFGATPSETALVGDSPIDLDTARNAGVFACLARYGFGFRFTDAELRGVFVVDSPREIAQIVTAEAAGAEDSRIQR